MWIIVKNDELEDETLVKVVGVYVHGSSLMGYITNPKDYFTLGRYQSNSKAIEAFNRVTRAIANNGNIVDLNRKI